MKRINLISLFLLLILLIATPTTNDYIKMILVAIILLTSVDLSIKKKDFSFYQIMFLFISFNILTFIHGYLKFGTLAFYDFKIFVWYFFVFTILKLAITDEIKIKEMDFAIRIAAFIINIYLITFVFSSLNVIPFEMIDFLKQDMFFAKGLGFFKIYGLNTVSYAFLTPYIISTYLFYSRQERMDIKGGEIFNNVNLVLTIISTILTLRRAYLISALIVFIILFLILDIKKTRALITLSFVIGIFVIFTIFNGNYYIELMSSFDFENNRSNAVRLDQFYAMWDYIKENLIIGYGYGFHMPGLLRNANLVSYELQYLKLFATSGLLGICLYFYCYFRFFLISIKKIRLNRTRYLYLLPAVAGQLSVVIANGFNPIVSQFSALIFIFYPIYVYYVYKEE